MNGTQDDTFYVDKVLRGDSEAFRALVERYHKMVFGIAYNMTRNQESAQDTVQEVFYRAFRKLDRYNPVYPFGVWIRRITVNYLLDQRKKKKLNAVSMTTEDDDTWDIEDTDSSPREEKFKKDQEKVALGEKLCWTFLWQARIFQGIRIPDPRIAINKNTRF